MTFPRPIEIIGGGLAGLALGLALRRAGVPVTIVEAGHYPRHRVCGEFITGLSAATITTLGLTPYFSDALHHREVAWFIGADATTKPTRIQRLPSSALGLSRHALDHRLATAFTAAGGVLLANTRFPETDTASVPGRVFTTGRRRSRSPWLGLKIHARDVTLTRDLELHLGDHAYVGLARVEDGSVNVCGLFRRRALCAKGPNLLLGYLQAAGLTALAARLATSELAADSFCAVAAVSFDRRVIAPPPGRMCLGDTCAMIPPFTGNGMAMAFQSAETALPPLLAYARGAAAWSDTCEVISRALRRRFRLRLASAAAVHPFLFSPPRQRVLSALNRVRLVPLAPLYAALH
jgi:2-polyprenyl-6-methoxyphenol hydroxylase-like FAD-dependent oxidoreductase